MGKKSRTKGKSGELEVVHLLKESGFKDAKRKISQYQQSSVIDLEGTEPYYIQVKREAKKPRAEAILDSMRAEVGLSGYTLLFQRGDKGEWIVSMPAWVFIELAQIEKSYWKHDHDSLVNLEGDDDYV